MFTWMSHNYKELNISTADLQSILLLPVKSLTQKMAPLSRGTMVLATSFKLKSSH